MQAQPAPRRVTVERVRPGGGVAIPDINQQQGQPTTPVKTPRSGSAPSREPHSPTSPHVGEAWRTGSATSHGWGWFQPSPTPKSPRESAPTES
ncbi:hypothetical protein Ndes2526B_g08703 [Nannochloris sp. 'desiccata']|nr:hypothetical protein NADE_000980 [Chlorella desiccata (nom. nud.)]KAH7616608.1 hypothetical protein NADE_001420 [Chlorella desiccata (nom. nud.)]